MAVTLDEYKEKFLKDRQVILKIKVFPQAGYSGYVKTLGDGTLKIAVKAAPEKGKANRELVRFMAASFAVPVEQVAIVKGINDRIKMVRISA